MTAVHGKFGNQEKLPTISDRKVNNIVQFVNNRWLLIQKPDFEIASLSNSELHCNLSLQCCHWCFISVFWTIIDTNISIVSYTSVINSMTQTKWPLLILAINRWISRAWSNRQPQPNKIHVHCIRIHYPMTYWTRIYQLSVFNGQLCIYRAVYA